MKVTALSKVAGALVAAASFVAPAAIVVAPSAHADSDQEFYFFQYLDKKGVPYGRKMDAVREAKSTCLKISRPGDPGSIGYGVYESLKKDLGITTSQAAIFTEASIYQYCPQVWHIDQK